MLCKMLNEAHFFGAVTVLGVALPLLRAFTLRWILSGAPVMTYCILLGQSKGYRVLPNISLYTLFPILHLVYAISATSWLLYWVFAAGCYPMILISCLFQFDTAANFARWRLRKLLRELQFTNDKVALFNLPALEIDTDVDGLFVIRGITISFSSLLLTVHGCEVGIKLSNDMELALQVEEVKVSFFRKIEISDVYANIKGGKYEMTFAEVPSGDINDASGGSIFESDTPLLRAATISSQTHVSKDKHAKAADEMTGGSPPEPHMTKSGLNDVRKLSVDDDEALEQYERSVRDIKSTSAIYEAWQIVDSSKTTAETHALDKSDPKQVRAAICSQLHKMPTVPHAPQSSIKVTTLQNLSSPFIKRFMHRLPLLLRLLLNPFSYFHPVEISSITAAASGAWIQALLKQALFRDFADSDKAIRDLEQKIFSWISEARFVCGLGSITANAQVPLLAGFDIVNSLVFHDIVLHRAISQKLQMHEVVRLGGADAVIKIPTFLLPHHEHLLPPLPTQLDKEGRRQEVKQADGIPKAIQAEEELKQTVLDETVMSVSAHVKLPACFDGELLAFAAAIVKASKIIEMEKEPDAMEAEVKGVKDFAKALHSSVKDGLKRSSVEVMVNDRWIAKLVTKIAQKCEKAQGNAGYQADVAIPLAPYRRAAEKESKLLP